MSPEQQAAQIKSLTLERDKLRTLVVSVFEILYGELLARRDLYDCRDDEIPDSRVRHEVQVLQRFVIDARTHVDIINEAMNRHEQRRTNEQSS